MIYKDNAVKDLRIAYIGGGSRGWVLQVPDFQAVQHGYGLPTLLREAPTVSRPESAGARASVPAVAPEIVFDGNLVPYSFLLSTVSRYKSNFLTRDYTD